MRCKGTYYFYKNKRGSLTLYPFSPKIVSFIGEKLFSAQKNIAKGPIVAAFSLTLQKIR